MIAAERVCISEEEAHTEQCCKCVTGRLSEHSILYAGGCVALWLRKAAGCNQVL